MKATVLAITALLLVACELPAAQPESVVQLETETGVLEGSLLAPEGKTDIPVALIIAGSGPTDRDGNNSTMINNSLKMLATELSQHGVASLRYDKRGVAKSLAAGGREVDLRFDHFIADAEGWIGYLRSDNRFNEVIVIGHSEGSLIGMMAARQGKADKYISIAGPGQRVDELIRKQLGAQPSFILEQADPILDELVKGNTVEDTPQVLNALFRPSVQPYLISWLKYDPRVEIAKLEIPVLILQGTTDIQIGVTDAEMLAEANQKAEVVIIDGMNHVFKESELDRLINLQTYSQPDLPIVPEMITAVVEFIEHE